MDGPEYFPTSIEMMPPEQVGQLPERIWSILCSLHRGYGIDGRGPDEGSVAFGQVMLGELLKDLYIDLPAKGAEIVYDDWKFVDLPIYALAAVPAIAAAPNLTYEQRVELVALYPELITGSGFRWTYLGGKSAVRKTLEVVKRGAPDAQAELQSVIRGVEKTWRREQAQRVLGFAGSIVTRLTNKATSS